ncbi:unnamed protein product [Cuscuta epithymum]|uniref:DUF1985 domain-containing protein n=1 Tax=Cuscuta epithymum TaxID=186058 RepID=A0AAV0CIL2_9ASTE|nr:unnamed protein product [Cuscuta epithymum]
MYMNEFFCVIRRKKHELMVPVESHFPAQYSLCSSFGKYKNLLAAIPASEQQNFKNLPWGHLAETPELQFSGQIVHMLLLRMVRRQPVDELWFSIRGKIFKFTFQDFCAITHLPAYTTRPRFVKNSDKGSVAKLFFKRQKRVTYEELKETMAALNPKRRVDSLAVVKLASLFVVDCMLLARNHDTKINANHLDWVEDFENFKKYPWALESYNLMVSNMKSLMRDQPEKYEAAVANKPKYKNCKFTVWALPHVLQVWAYEKIPGLAPRCGTKFKSEEASLFN